MIRIRPIGAPFKLTSRVEKELTEEYKKTGKAVWQKEFIAKELLEASHSKCCFSECKLNEEGKYDEIEHFHPKSLYPDEVVSWNNLLPINKACNIAKGDHDTRVEPIINPRFDNPKEHIYLSSYRFYGKTDLGRRTIDVVGLNDWDMWVTPRFEIGRGIYALLESINDLAQDYDLSHLKSTIKRNRLSSRLRGLMVEGTERYIYSAIVATILLNEELYREIKMIFIKNDLWSDSFESLEEEVRYCALDVKP